MPPTVTQSAPTGGPLSSDTSELSTKQAVFEAGQLMPSRAMYAWQSRRQYIAATATYWYRHAMWQQGRP